MMPEDTSWDTLAAVAPRRCSFRARNFTPRNRLPFEVTALCFVVLGVPIILAVRFCDLYVRFL